LYPANVSAHALRFIKLAECGKASDEFAHARSTALDDQGSSAACSAARAALRIFRKPRLPSWHAYSNTVDDASRFSGIANAHGAAQVSGSSRRTSQRNVSASIGVKRSVTFSASLAFR